MQDKQVVAYCLADGFHWSKLQANWSSKKLIHEKINGDLVTLFEEKTAQLSVAVFEYGCVVFWGGNASYRKTILSQLRRFIKCEYLQRESEVFILQEAKSTHIEGNTIQLATEKPAHKIAISYAMAQAVRLGQYEGLVAQTYDDLNSVIASLAQRGRVRMRSGKVLRKTGQLFYVRTQINLHSDLLDTPDYFWDRPEEEAVYAQVYNELDISKRLDNLNNRLDIMQDLYTMLSEQIKHQHSVWLEIIIIVLIGVEVMTTWLQWGSGHVF